MAIYQPPTKRWRIAVAGAILGAIVGFAVGATVTREPEPDPVDVIASVDADLDAAAGLLEVVAIEYEEAVEDGRVVADAEYRGAQSGLDRVRGRYELVRDAVEAIDRKAAERIADRIADLRRMIADREASDEVEEATRDLAEEMREVIERG